MDVYAKGTENLRDTRAKSLPNKALNPESTEKIGETCLSAASESSPEKEIRPEKSDPREEKCEDRFSVDGEERDGKEMYMMRKNEMRMNETVQNGTRRKREGINRTGHNEAKIIPDKAERDGKKGMGQYETGKNRTRRNGEGNRTGRNEMGNRTG
ncbi:unnamed protein product [Microthlaspi erraticum]|uniref:Uncharacterized protein n=1 Tax=Microthlaspi erraticum TaxID=1685480 RepID=A0A6D2L1X1_9BRAS|nr:unnamed protein product [Microthlaspi erraticum]